MEEMKGNELEMRENDAKSLLTMRKCLCKMAAVVKNDRKWECVKYTKCIIEEDEKMEKIRVMMVDDSTAVLEQLGDYLACKEELNVVARVEDGMAALEVLERFDIDVMVLDMVMPKLDGFGVLEALQHMDLLCRPRVIALTALTRDDFIQRAISLGADYYMLKPYDENAVYERILALAKPDEPLHPNSHIQQKAAVHSLDERIANIFLSMGIPAHIKGYHFLREAIKLVVYDRDMINAITKDLYPTVAKRFSTTSSKVERAIRHAIDVAWNRGQMENINLLFGSRLYIKHDKPTNGEFIAMIADRLAIEISA